MNAQTIRALVPLLPPDAAYPPGQSATSRLQHCLFDPAFPWHFVRTFVEAGKPLPLEVHDVILRKAWAWQRHGKPNAVLDEAYEIKHPANHATAALLHALLICPDIKLEKIAELMGLPVAVVTAYEALFFNVRDRLNDQAYLARLIYPESRFPGMETDAVVSTEAQLLQAAYEYGSEEALYMAGLIRKRERADINNEYAELETAIVDNAMTLASFVFGFETDPMLSPAQRVSIPKNLASQEYPA